MSHKAVMLLYYLNQKRDLGVNSIQISFNLLINYYQLVNYNKIF